MEGDQGNGEGEGEGEKQSENCHDLEMNAARTYSRPQMIAHDLQCHMRARYQDSMKLRLVHT